MPFHRADARRVQRRQIEPFDEGPHVARRMFRRDVASKVYRVEPRLWLDACGTNKRGARSSPRRGCAKRDQAVEPGSEVFVMRQDRISTTAAIPADLRSRCRSG